MPFTFFKSSALRNGRAAIIRAAITGPMPGTLLSSFSVAVLTSILPSPGASFACDLLVSTGLVVAMGEVGAGIAEIDAGEFAKSAARGRAVFPATKILKGARFCA